MRTVAQQVDAGQVGALHVEPLRRAAHGEERRVVGQAPIVRQVNAFAVRVEADGLAPSMRSIRRSAKNSGGSRDGTSPGGISPDTTNLLSEVRS